MVGITLRKHPDETVAPGYVKPPVSWIEGHVIRPPHRRKRCNRLARLRVEDYELCWFARNDEQSMVFLIQRHGHVFGGIGNLPGLEQLAAFFIKNTYLTFGAHIGKHSGSIVLKGDGFHPATIDTDLVHLLCRESI